MGVPKENKARATECLKCNPPDLHDVGPEARKYLQIVRHQHFLDFVTTTDLARHLKMVGLDDTNINAVLNWYGTKKMLIR